MPVSTTPTEPPESTGLAASPASAGAPALRLYDSAARAVVPLAPTATPGLVTIYLCGATVQGSPHIGHMRSGIAFDVLRRWLERGGLDRKIEIIIRGVAAGLPPSATDTGGKSASGGDVSGRR